MQRINAYKYNEEKKKTTVGNSEIIKKWKLTKEVCKIFKFLNYIVNSVY